MTDWRQDQVLRTRRAIRQAAAELQAEGVDVSIANIARRAQRHPKTVRRHYGGVGEILLVSCASCAVVDLIIAQLVQMPDAMSPVQMVMGAMLWIFTMPEPGIVSELSARMRKVAQTCSADPNTMGMLVADYLRCAQPRLQAALMARSGRDGPAEQLGALLPSLTGQMMMQIWETEGYERPMVEVWREAVAYMGSMCIQDAAWQGRPSWASRPPGQTA